MNRRSFVKGLCVACVVGSVVPVVITKEKYLQDAYMLGSSKPVEGAVFEFKGKQYWLSWDEYKKKLDWEEKRKVELSNFFFDMRKHCLETPETLGKVTKLWG